MSLNHIINGLIISILIFTSACSSKKELNTINTIKTTASTEQNESKLTQTNYNNDITNKNTSENEDTVELKSEKIQFTTPDNFIIKGKLYYEGKCYHTVLLLPMLGHTKESYIPLISKLIDNRYNVLAIDMRGHGLSRDRVNGKPKSFESFTKDDWEKLTIDASSALKFLCEQKQNCTNIYIIGASIGANTAIISGKKHPGKVIGIIALSPGEEFHGLKPIGYIDKVKPTLLIAAKDDDYSFESVENFKKTIPNNVTSITYPEGGHGTDLFETQPELINTIIEWMEKNPSSTKRPKECN